MNADMDAVANVLFEKPIATPVFQVLLVLSRSGRSSPSHKLLRWLCLQTEEYYHISRIVQAVTRAFPENAVSWLDAVLLPLCVDDQKLEKSHEDNYVHGVTEGFFRSVGWLIEHHLDVVVPFADVLADMVTKLILRPDFEPERCNKAAESLRRSGRLSEAVQVYVRGEMREPVPIAENGYRRKHVVDVLNRVDSGASVNSALGRAILGEVAGKYLWTLDPKFRMKAVLALHRERPLPDMQYLGR